MLIIVNLLVIALVIIGAFALSSSGARTRDARSVDEPAAGTAKLAQSPNARQA